MTVDFSNFKFLTFDCYGTLVDWETGILSTAAPWFAGIEAEKILAAFAAAETAEQARTPGKPYPGILEATYTQMAKTLGVRSDPVHGKAFGASVGAWPAFADSSTALARLRKRFNLGILSNVDHASFAATEARLGVIFDLVVTAADVGTYKPNRQNFQTLLSRLADRSVGRQEILHVAQSLYHDHVPAQEMGLTTCWIDRRGGRGGGAVVEAPGVKPHLSFPTLAALADAAGV